MNLMSIIILYYFSIVVVNCYIDTILENTRDENEHGYHFKYRTQNGQEREETGVIERIGATTIIRVTGYFSYLDTTGKQYKVTYSADEDGYKPQVYPPYLVSQQPIEQKIQVIIAPAALASLAGGGLG